MNTSYSFKVQAMFLLVLGLFLSSAPTIATENLSPCEIVPNAVTTDDPGTPLEILELRLKPLTRCELQGEAMGWLSLLKAKVHEISSIEIEVNYKRVEIEMTDEARDALEETQESSGPGSAGEETADSKAAEGMNAIQKAAKKQAETKSNLLKKLTKLREERTEIIDRLNMVLDALEAKGGTTDELRKYIKEVSGIKVDVTDTEATWTTLTGWLLSPEGGLRWGKNIALFLVTFLVFWFIAKFTQMIIRRAISRSKNIPVLLGKFIVSSIHRVILFIGFIVALAMLEVQVGPILALIGAAGFVVAFALQNSLANFASGILILIYRPFDVDDYVEIAGIGGTVQSLNLLSVTITTPDNKTVVVSNNSIWGQEIVNYTAIDKRRVDMVFGIGYEDDIEKAQRTLEEVVAEHDLVLDAPKPTICVNELADSSVNFICRPWVRPQDYWQVYWDITRKVKERFDQEGISIPYPQRDVHLHQT